jgi:hypothetical protein
MGAEKGANFIVKSAALSNLGGAGAPAAGMVRTHRAAEEKKRRNLAGCAQFHHRRRMEETTVKHSE